MITDTDARRIACSWHGGGGTALYALCSTGAISDDAALEIEICQRDVQNDCTSYSEFDAEELIKFKSYVRAAGPREPVNGWSALVW